MIAAKTPQRVLVTGASGFLGGRLVEAMAISKSRQPVGAIRQWTRAARIARHAADVVLCNILDRDQTMAAVEGVDAIVHCAYSGDRDSIVNGTKNLLEAAATHGIERFIYLSSAEVYDNSQAGELDESSPTPTRHGADYKNAKIKAEAYCRDFRSTGVRATILRPSIIYGPFSSSWTVNCVKRLQSGKWGNFPACEGTANLVYVDDLVRAIFLCLDKREAMGTTFNVNGPDRLTWNEYFAALNESLGLPPLSEVSSTKSQLRTRLMDVIGSMADVVLARYEDQLMEIYLRGGWASKIMKKIKGELDATPSSDELNDLYARRVYYSDAKARDALGYAPEFDLRRGLRLTLAWLQLHELAGSHGDAPTAVTKLREEVVAS